MRQLISATPSMASFCPGPSFDGTAERSSIGRPNAFRFWTSTPVAEWIHSPVRVFSEILAAHLMDSIAL